MSKVLAAAVVLATATAAQAESPTQARFAKLCKAFNPTEPLLLDVHAGIPFVNIRSVDTMGRPDRDTRELFELGGNVCPIEGLQLGADYVFRFLPDSDFGTGIFLVHGTYMALHSGPLAVGVSGALFFDFTGGGTDDALGLGAWVSFEPVDNVQIFTGQPVPFPFVLTPIPISIPPVAYQLSLGFNHNQPIALSIPGGVMFEPIPELTLMGAIDIADIFFTNPQSNRNGTAGTTHAYLFGRDFIPLTVGGLYSIGNRADVGMEISLDARHAGDFVIVTLFAQVGVF